MLHQKNKKIIQVCNEMKVSKTTSSFSVFVLYLPFLTSRSRSFSLGWVSARFRKMTNSAVSQSVGGTQWVSQWPPDCCYNTTDPQSHHPLSEHVILSLFSNTHLYNNQKNNHKQKPLSRDWEGRSIFFIRADASLKGTLAGVGKSR